MSQNQNKRTLRTIGLVVAVTLLTKILGIVREALQAGVFGTQTASTSIRSPITIRSISSRPVAYACASRPCP